MKTKKAIIIFTVLILIFNTIFPVFSFATNDDVVELKIVASETELERGDEVSVSVEMNTNSVNNANLITIRLKYDTNVLEPVGDIVLGMSKPSESDILQTQIDEENGKIYYLYSGVDSYLNYNGTLFTQKFKVKEDAVIGNSSITIENDTGEKIIEGTSLIDFLPLDSQPSYTVETTSINVIQPVNSISLNKTSSELWVGENDSLTVTYSPEDATNQTVTWSSSDSGIATVTDGVITAISKGTTTVTATSSNGKTATCEVKVKQPVTGVTLNKSSLELEKDQTESLVATILPSNTDGDKTITWSSSNSSVATVSNGIVTAVGKGSADIIATTANGYTATCKVTVGIPLKSISFENDITEKTLNKSEQFILSIVYNPTDTDVDKTITWSSTDTSVATVENGVITAIGGGETEITATSVNGLTATCKIKVEVPLTSISIKQETSLQYGQTEKLEVTYTPVDTTTDKTISWSSSDETIAKVLADGTIQSIGVGETTIIAKSSNGLEATCKVTVLPVELNSISIKEQNITLNKGQNQNLTVIYNPENTTDDKTITWSSTDTSVATVENGVITAIKAGKTTITAQVGDKTATTEVEVKVPLESISLSETEKQLNKGDSLKLEITYNPDDTTADKTITWSSTDSTVAEVSEDGNVIALNGGVTYIKAKVEDKEVSCKINVTVPLTGIELNKDSSEILKGQSDKLSVTLSPNDTTYTGKIEWTSSDETVATVDESGNVKGIKEGKTIITVKAVENGNEFSDVCEFTVKEIPLNSISIDISDFDLGLGRTQKLGIICNPENTTDDKTVTWTSSNETVATVDENGVVTANALGQSIISAIIGDKIANVTVTVKEIPITSITINTDSKVSVGKNLDVKLTINPIDATYKLSDLKFVSSNSDILYVNEDGTITAKGKGIAILTVEATNGVKSQVEIEVFEEIDESTESATETVITSNSPKTGDIAIEILIGLMAISCLGIIVILRKKLKNNLK